MKKKTMKNWEFIILLTDLINQIIVVFLMNNITRDMDSIRHMLIKKL